MANKRKTKRNKLILLLSGLLLLVVIILIAFTKSTFVSNEQKGQTIISEATPSKSAEVTKLDSQTEKWKTYTISNDKTFSFKLPPDWKDFENWNPMPPNAYGIQSPNFSVDRSRGGFSVVSGSFIDLVIDKMNPISFEDSVGIEGNGGGKITGYYETPDFKAVKFTHTCCESGNSTDEVLFFRNGQRYKIGQHYHLNSTNPYPNLLEQIVSTFTFTK